MKLTKRQLKRIIREEYSRLKRRGLINEMGFRDMRGGHGRQRSYQDMEADSGRDNRQACIDACMAAIPAGMKQMCKLGFGHSVINDVYHLCAPICEEMGCDCDDISSVVHNTLCGR